MKKLIELCDYCEDEFDDNTRGSLCVKCNEIKLCDDCSEKSESGYMTDKQNLVCSTCVEKLIKGKE